MKKKMKKNIYYIIIGSILIIAAIFVILIKNGVFRSEDDLGPISEALAIKDTSAVKKLFIADMRGNQVLLSRDGGSWIVDDSIPALEANIDDILSTLKNIAVIQVVPKKAQQTIIRSIALRGIKVEIYAISPKFTFLGIKFGVKERKIKTYYIGEATQNNLGNYVVVEGIKEPLIVGIPGFRGFISPRFSPISSNWYSHILFQTKITRIQSLTFTDEINPEESFKVEKAGARFFNLYDGQNRPIYHYDTTKLINMLSEFREKNYTTLAETLTQGERDTIFQNHFKTITLTDVNGNTTILKTYYLVLYQEAYFNNEPTGKWEYVINKDRFYGTLNDDTTTIYRLQYFLFDRQLQPLSNYLKAE